MRGPTGLPQHAQRHLLRSEFGSALLNPRPPGSFPPELDNLAALDHMDLSSNGLIGSIPPELGNLNKLVRLLLWGNALTGSIPLELVNLGRLETLSFGSNRLTGPIPEFLDWLDGVGSFRGPRCRDDYGRDRETAAEAPLGGIVSGELDCGTDEDLFGVTIPQEGTLSLRASGDARTRLELSLLHAPCGDPAGVDPHFPHRGGLIGGWGYDFSTNQLVDPEWHTDLTTYRRASDWISDHSFAKAADYRTDASGRELFSYSFAMAGIADMEEDAASFVFAVPAPDAWADGRADRPARTLVSRGIPGAGAWRR